MRKLTLAAGMVTGFVCTALLTVLVRAGSATDVDEAFGDADVGVVARMNGGHG